MGAPGDTRPQYRRSLRLPDYDYALAGAYFITVCTQDRECVFGEINDREMRLNKAGRIAWECWLELPDHFPTVVPDEFVVMPNHVHGIVHIERRGTACRAPTTTERFGKPVRDSLPTIVRSFKSAVTKNVNQMHRTPGQRLWQRNYYEHVIRDQRELDATRQYIVDNPAKWAEDRENPQNIHR